MTIFVEGTSILKKLSLWLLLVLFFGMTIGVFSKVIVVDPWVEIFSYLWLFLSLVAVYFLVKKRDWVYSTCIQRQTGKVKPKWIVIVSGILLIPFIIMILISKGLPSFLHFFIFYLLKKIG